MGMYYIPTYILTFIMFIIYGFTQYKTFQLVSCRIGVTQTNLTLIYNPGAVFTNKD